MSAIVETGPLVTRSPASVSALPEFPARTARTAAPLDIGEISATSGVE